MKLQNVPTPRGGRGPLKTKPPHKDQQKTKPIWYWFFGLLLQKKIKKKKKNPSKAIPGEAFGHMWSRSLCFQFQ